MRKKTEGERVEKVADVGVGKEIREEGGKGEATEENLGRARESVLMFCLSVFAFIKCVIYLSANYEDIHF